MSQNRLIAIGAPRTKERRPRGSELTLAPLHESPERFVLDPARRIVERCITRTDGTVAKTRFPLKKEFCRSSNQADLARAADQAFLRSSAWPSLNTTGPPIKLVDLFCGCGIMSLGVWEACRALGRSVDPVVAADFNATAIRVYKRNFPTASVLTGNIEESLNGDLGEDPTPVEQTLVAKVGQIDLAIGGPPCQGHSDLNNHTRRSDPKNKLYDRLARFAELVRPTHIIVENVSAVLHDRGRVVERTAAWLKSLGYSLSEGIGEVSDIGVPQKRRRHVLVASLTRSPNVAEWLALYHQRHRTVGWAIGDLRKLRSGVPFDEPGRATEANRKRIAYLFKEDVYELPNRLRPDCHRLKDHTYQSVYGRMFWNQPAQTITSGFGCMGQGRYVHPKEQRTLTPHEAARLQFIPDFFQFGADIPRTLLAEMIGNAVPVKLTYCLALELLR